MKNLRLWGLCLLAVSFSRTSWAYENPPPPISLSVFGLYGSPVAPTFLAHSITDGYGFEALGEWNPITYASLGLSYETMAFQGSPGFNFQSASLEGRVFPLENGRGKFSPYIMGAAGLNLGTGGNLVLKAGLGSRVAFIGPTFIDVNVGSHWVQDPGSFQYVDARVGFSLWFDLKGKSSSSKPDEQAPQASKPAPKPTEAPVVTATPVVSPVVTPTVAAAIPTPTTTPQELVLQEPPPMTPVFPSALSGPPAAVKALKKYYKLGMKAFLAEKYTASLKYLRKSLAVKEVHGAGYYYAETYSTIGVIYHFHSKLKNHKALALKYYKKALKIDPTTKAAKKYIKLLQGGATTKAKHLVKPMPTPTPSDDSISVDTSNTGSSTKPGM